MATSKANRQPPSRVFENYVLTRVTAPGAGLVDIPDSKFEQIPGTAGDGFSDDALSNLIPIGFDFSFDGITYRQICVNTNGWMALADPALANSTLVQTSLLPYAPSWENESIGGLPSSAALVNPNQPGLFNVVLTGSNSTMLCPWFDDLRNRARDAAQTGLITANTQTRQLFGYESPSILYDNIEFGVKIYRDVRSSQGRRTIIRWNSLSDYNNASTVIKFEVVIYENGAIEFRYVPRQNLTLQETTSGGNFIEDATVGIFAPGTNRYRDFSPGLGYLDGARQTYKYGGVSFVSGTISGSNFQDLGFETFASVNRAKPYVWRLRPATHWPGLTNFGTILRFAPPQNRRRVLPRNLQREKDSRVSSTNRFFDDRKSTPFITGAIVNYPTTLQRFIGDSETGVTERQDLFSGDFLVTGSIVKSAVEQFLENRENVLMKPFSEANQHDQVGARSDVFYISGSGVDMGDRFDTPLWSKSQIKMSFPVDYVTRTIPIKSSVYYYNVRSKIWLQPANTTIAGSDIAFPILHAQNARILEDHRGFGPIGTLLASGSTNVVNTGSVIDRAAGFDNVINTAYTPDQAIRSLQRPFEKSINENPEYKATNDELFEIPITQPFLIEKAVFQIPLACGYGWFNDKTTSFFPLVGSSGFGSFDFAGPGMTVALFRQVQVGNLTRRDLIMTGTITHVSDSISSLTLSSFSPLTSDFQIRPTGYLSYASEAGAVVVPNRGTGISASFTGSVSVKAEALISNGVLLKFSKEMVAEPSSEYPTNRQAVLDLLDQPQLTLISGSGLYQHGYNIAYVNTFGRGESGLNPSGRSILGKEFATSQGIIKNGNKVKNPFYTTGSVRTQISASLLSGNRFRAVAMIPLSAHFKSPYLALPGDKLILVFAKSRPFYYSNYELGGPESSGSIQHDVDLITGTIHLSLYGSMLREGKEFHDTLPRNLTSPAIFETIGNDPVLDQFEVAYRDEFIGGRFDDFITGTLVASTLGTNQVTTTMTGTRGKVFSEFSARFKATPDTSPAELAANPSKAFRLQPWWEKSGTPRVSNYFDDSERYWDTLMPSVADAFIRDGLRMWLMDGNTNSFINETNVNTTRIAFATFDGKPGVGSNQNLYVNLNWTKAFPYEPRYAGVQRQKVLQKSLVAKMQLSGGNWISTDPVQCESLFLGMFGSLFATGNSTFVHWWADTNLVTNITSSMNSDDTSRFLFGFGDLNNCVIDNNHIRNGTNHAPYSRDYIRSVSSFGVASTNRYRIGPIIRGWKYGVRSGLPEFSRAVFRLGRFGQLRDMLEQKPYAKFYLETAPGRPARVSTAVISVKFVDSLGNVTAPQNTTSQNLSSEVTSSMPFFDGEIRNRTDINANTLNQSVVSFKADQFNNVAL